MLPADLIYYAQRFSIGLERIRHESDEIRAIVRRSEKQIARSYELLAEEVLKVWHPEPLKYACEHFEQT